MKHETQLYVDRVETLAQLPAEQRRAVQNSPRLQSVLEENRALRQLAAGAAEPPSRARLLGHVYSQAGSKQEHKPMSFKRLFTGKPLALRIALGAALLLVIACLSIILPRVMFSSHGIELRGMQPAYAATEGFLLLYDFGAADHASVKPLIDQLKKAVQEFETAHNPSSSKEKHEFKVVVALQQREIKHKQDAGKSAAASSVVSPQNANQLVVVVNLPDDKLLNELQAELAKIPGLPEPQVKDATWFSEKGLPLPGDDAINLELGLGDKQHAFNFPKHATAQEIQLAIEAWLKENHPEMTFEVSVDKQAKDDGMRLEIKVESAADSSAAKESDAADDSAEASDSESSVSVSGSASSSSSSSSSSSGSSSSNSSGGGSSSGASGGGGGGNAGGGGGGSGHAGGGGGGNAGGGGSSSSSSDPLKLNSDSTGRQEFEAQSAAARKAMEDEMNKWRAEHAQTPDMDSLKDGQGDFDLHSTHNEKHSSSSNSTVKLSQSQPSGGDMKFTLNIDGQKHEFKFAAKATEAEITKQLQNWLKKALPDRTYKVAVKKTSTKGQVKLDLVVESTSAKDE